MSAAPAPAPSITLTSFACPHCGAHASQSWFKLFATQLTKDRRVPFFPTQDGIQNLVRTLIPSQDEKERAKLQSLVNWSQKMALGRPFIDRFDDPNGALTLNNLFVSQCYTCGDIAIWLHDSLLYPPTMSGPSPNPDLSEDVRCDYEEARQILNLSPRGAAALLRLSIEKICIELKAEGNDINQRIAALVAKGLPNDVQMALDAVRVIGNEAVHPGQLDLKDNRDTATKLFDLVNFIADEMISRPKQIKGLYKMIPPEKLQGIEARNVKALQGKA